MLSPISTSPVRTNTTPSSASPLSAWLRTMNHRVGSLCITLVIMAITLGYQISIVSATAGQILKVVTSDGGSTFYVGRCFRTDLKVQTDNLNANSVDVILMYNASYLLPYTGSGCTIAATAIQTDGLFGSYPANTIGGGLVEVTGYDPTGSSPVNTGSAPADRLLGHIYWKVIAVSGSYTLPFQFTLGSTIDTNMAQQGGDGSDVLDSVENLTIVLANDTTAPTFTNLSPSSGATGVSVTSGVTYTFNDAGAGVATGTLTNSLNGTSKNKTYSGCSRANSNRIASCNITMSSVGTLSYNTLYRVSATGSDAASPSANSANQTWTFTTEDDTDAPYLASANPADGASGVSLGSNIVFHLKDYKNNAGVTPGLGVDISTVSVTVTPSGGSPITYTSASGEFGYTGTSEDYTITINPAANFAANTSISVAVDASDLHSSANAMSTATYSFSTADTTAPAISGLSPDTNETGVATTANVIVHVTDSGAGISIGNTTVTVNGTAYTSASGEFGYTGTSADYTVTINPASDFTDNSVVSVTVSTRDQASTPNTATQTYGFYVGSTTTTVTTTCSTSTESAQTSGGNSRRTSSILGSIFSADIPTIIARKRIPGTETVTSEQLSPEEARRVEVCYIDKEPLHAAPKEKASYNDVPLDSWYADAVQAFVNLGILDSTTISFRPSDPSARAELAKVLGKLHGDVPALLITRQNFDDVVRDAWYAPFVEFAGTKGWMRGYGNCLGTHPCRALPAATISRAEAVTMLVRFYGLKKTSAAPLFADVHDADWYAEGMATAADHCVLQGVNGSSRAAPSALLTRAEMVVLLDRARRGMTYGIDCGKEVPSSSAAAASVSAKVQVVPSSRSTLSSVSSVPESSESSSTTSAVASITSSAAPAEDLPSKQSKSNIDLTGMFTVIAFMGIGLLGRIGMLWSKNTL